jgi:hypothetical protein
MAVYSVYNEIVVNYFVVFLKNFRLSIDNNL